MSWSEVPDTVKKALVAVIAVLTAGFLLRDFVELPEIVKDNTQRIETVERAVRGQGDKLDQMLCMQLAEKQGGNWEDCVRN